MNRLKAKLKSTSGMSMVFALVIFIMVTVFSTTMVTGALTAVQNASLQLTQEQMLLAARSAEKLFLSRIVEGEDGYYVKKVELKDEEPYPAEPAGTVPEIQNENLRAQNAATVMLNLQRSKYDMETTEDSAYLLCTETDTDSGTVVTQSRFTAGTAPDDDTMFLYALCSMLTEEGTDVTRTFTISMDDMPDTSVALTMDENGSVTAEFSVLSESGEELYKEKIVLSCTSTFTTETKRAWYSYDVYYPAVYSEDDPPEELEPEVTKHLTGVHPIKVETTDYTWTIDSIAQNEVTEP